MRQKIILQLGTNNWQRQGEFAPGSGILHEAHHLTYSGMADVKCYSIYPSKIQTSTEDEVRVFPLEHDIPICESVSPVSSYRFHSMPEEEFESYINRLQTFAESFIEEIEQKEGRPIDIAIAHHTFLNPLVLSRINEKREKEGKQKFFLLCFVHGTALKMFAHEKKGEHPEYPPRFYPFMRSQKVFEGANKVDLCAAISNEQIEKFLAIYDAFPRDKVVLSQNGFNHLNFKAEVGVHQRTDILSKQKLFDSPSTNAPAQIDLDIEGLVIFCGKFADWKRLDILLSAAKRYEKKNITTLIVGSGPEDAIEHYHKMAYDELGLKKTYFLGPKGQSELAALNGISDVGVYPSRNEPFGLVLIECLACGTPVIGVNSGGPKDFVTKEVGGLVPECEGEELIDHIYAMVVKSIEENWKGQKGEACVKYALDNFSILTQCEGILQAIRKT